MYTEMLNEKIAKEQQDYRDWLLSQQKEDILNYAFEYSVREDVVFFMDCLVYNECITEEQAKNLLEVEYLVTKLTDHIRNFGYEVDDVADGIDNILADFVKDKKIISIEK